jgi:hypothetical protein
MARKALLEAIVLNVAPIIDREAIIKYIYVFPSICLHALRIAVYPYMS